MMLPLPTYFLRRTTPWRRAHTVLCSLAAAACAMGLATGLTTAGTCQTLLATCTLFTGAQALSLAILLMRYEARDFS